MIYIITDEQIKQFNINRMKDLCTDCAFCGKTECGYGNCTEGYLRHNIIPLKQEHFSKMSTETLCSLMDVLQSEIKNREENKRNKYIEDLRQRYKELSQEAKELGIELC